MISHFRAHQNALQGLWKLELQVSPEFLVELVLSGTEFLPPKQILRWCWCYSGNYGLKSTVQAPTTQRNRFTYLYSILESSQLNEVGHFPS